MAGVSYTAAFHPPPRPEGSPTVPPPRTFFHEFNPTRDPMELTLELKRLQGDFERQVEALSGQVAAECYQCGNCTAGCPTAYEMGIKPNPVIPYLHPRH